MSSSSSNGYFTSTTTSHNIHIINMPNSNCYYAPQQSLPVLPPQLQSSHKLITRLSREIKQLTLFPPEGIVSCHTPNDTLTYLHVHMTGPPQSPFENGIFLLVIHIPLSYPQTPPTIHFVTPIHHPNIKVNINFVQQIIMDTTHTSNSINNNQDCGKIDLDLLTLPKSDWDDTITLSSLLTSIRTLLFQPNTNTFNHHHHNHHYHYQHNNHNDHYCYNDNHFYHPYPHLNYNHLQYGCYGTNPSTMRQYLINYNQWWNDARQMTYEYATLDKLTIYEDIHVAQMMIITSDNNINNCNNDDITTMTGETARTLDDNVRHNDSNNTTTNNNNNHNNNATTGVSIATNTNNNNNHNHNHNHSYYCIRNNKNKNCTSKSQLLFRDSSNSFLPTNQHISMFVDKENIHILQSKSDSHQNHTGTHHHHHHHNCTDIMEMTTLSLSGNKRRLDCIGYDNYNYNDNDERNNHNSNDNVGDHCNNENDNVNTEDNDDSWWVQRSKKLHCRE